MIFAKEEGRVKKKENLEVRQLDLLLPYNGMPSLQYTYLKT